MALVDGKCRNSEGMPGLILSACVRVLVLFCSRQSIIYLSIMLSAYEMVAFWIQMTSFLTFLMRIMTRLVNIGSAYPLFTLNRLCPYTFSSEIVANVDC